MKFLFPLFALVYLCSCPIHSQEIGLQSLNGFLGAWKHESTEMRSDGSSNTETGTMNAKWDLGQTYLKIDCTLNGNGYTRHYTQYIGFDSRSNQFQSTYMYSGTLEKVFESGTFNPELNQLELTGVNPFSSQLENGINIKSTFKIEAHQIVLELMELRANGQWELGYRAVFTKK